MKTYIADKEVGRLVLKGMDKMSAPRRRQIATWLAKLSKDVAAEGHSYAKRFTATYSFTRKV